MTFSVEKIQLCYRLARRREVERDLALMPVMAAAMAGGDSYRKVHGQLMSIRARLTRGAKKAQNGIAGIASALARRFGAQLPEPRKEP